MTDTLHSLCPATGALVWEGPIDQPDAVSAAVARSRIAQTSWHDRPLEARLEIARRYASVLTERASPLAETIARETGKPLWEARQEVASMVAKVDLSIRAQAERAGARDEATSFGFARLRHRPHGVMAVLGPYNFPGHLPNGHIVPALLAGNSVVFKPSEETPATGALMADAWRGAGLPEDVLIVVQGRRETGEALVAADIDGLLFTGSAATGTALRRALVDRPNVIVALELGGNNPLVAWDGDASAVASIVVASAFATSGQRCSCARRIIIPSSVDGDAIVAAVIDHARRLTIGQWDDRPEPAIGPLVSPAAARRARGQVAALRAGGAVELLPFADVAGRSAAFVTPAVLDVTGRTVADDEIFAPVIQITRVDDFAEAVKAANATRFGLSAGLISNDRGRWDAFRRDIRAGVVNWNRPTTGASGTMPFGGLGLSGNHRPSAYYAADYCAYPVASFESEAVENI